MSNRLELAVMHELEGKIQAAQPHVESLHYQPLLATTRAKPKQYTKATRRHEAKPVSRQSDIHQSYSNITQAKKDVLPNQGLPQAGTTPNTAVSPAVLSHHRSMKILKRYITARPVIEKRRNADTESDTSDTESDTSDVTKHDTSDVTKQETSDTESDTSEFTLTSPSPQQIGRNIAYSAHAFTETKSSGPCDCIVSTQPKVDSVVGVGVGQNVNSTDISSGGTFSCCCC